MTGHFEAKKHAYRQTQDGIVISFVVHPNDLDAALAVAPLGTRYMVGFAEIGDDDQPKSDGHSPTEKKRTFSSLPLSQQAGIRCSDLAFYNFLAAKGMIADEENCAQAVRRICKASSRAQFDMPGYPADAWKQLEDNFQAFRTDQMFAGQCHG